MSHEFRLGDPFCFQPVDEQNWAKLYIVLCMIRTISLASKKVYAKGRDAGYTIVAGTRKLTIG
jgi:hypothetical protein